MKKSIVHRLKNSIFYRSKYALEGVETKTLLRQLGAAGTSTDYPLELVRNVASVKSLCNGFDTLIDIGAYQGLFALLFNKVFPLSGTVCIEPNSKMLDIIRKNCSGINMQLFNEALSEKAETAKYYMHQDNSMNSIVTVDEKVLQSKFSFDDPKLITSKEVTTKTLDSLVFDMAGVRSNKLFIKIDTQGNELNILKGGTKTLEAARYCLVEHIFFNPYKSDYTFEELIEFMSSRHFICLGALSVIRTSSHEISAVDFLFGKKG